MFKVFSQQLGGTLTTAFETTPKELIISRVNLLKQKSKKVPGNYLHNNMTLLFEEHCTKTFHLLFYASSSLK